MNQPTQQEQVEELGNGITRKWLYGRQIVVYIMQDGGRNAIDTWADNVTADIQRWDSTCPYLALHHLANWGMTPYSTRRAEEVARQIPKTLHGRYASVISPGFIGQTIKLFGTRRLKVLLPQLESQFFFNYDTAVQWLKVGMR